MQKRNKVLLFIAILFTIFLLLGQLFHYPSAVRDIVTGEFLSNCKLVYPWIYVLFAPFFQLVDHLTILSLKQHFAFLFLLNVGWILFRIRALRGTILTANLTLMECGKFLLFQIVLFIFAGIIILVPRPMARLEVTDPDGMVLNFHSHTCHSWDARKSFTSANNLRWHERAGFHASFITDHNVFAGSEEGYQKSINDKSLNIRSMKGEEVSLYKSHWVLLGINQIVPNAKYDLGIEGIESFLKDMRKMKTVIVIASLPEYWFYHWGNDMAKFVEWGVQGFEIVNSATPSLDFTPELRASVVDFCREHNLIMMGATDNHGWGRTNYVWNIIHLPNWQTLPVEKLTPSVLELLKKERFKAVRVVVRIKAEPKGCWFCLIADPILQIWEASRSMPLSQTLSCIIWIWLVWFVLKIKEKNSQPKVI